MNIGIFGGTFDPPHNGHINLALKILTEANIDRIIFVPAALPPHKLEYRATPFHHRMNMLQLSIKGIKSFSISDIEYNRLPKPSFTFDTMNELEEQYEDDKLILIIGEDSLNQIHLWHRGKDIVEKWKILAYPRKDENVTLESLSKNWPHGTATKLLESMLHASIFPISATAIRNKIVRKEDIKSLVKPKVLEYISKNKLYQPSNTTIP